MQLSLDIFIVTSLRHLQRNRPTLLFYHGQVLQVLISVEEQLTRVELYEDAGHGPNITFLIPRQVFQDDFRRAILSSIDNEGVSFMLICRTAKIDYLDFAGGRLRPSFASLSRSALAREVARVINLTAFLTTIYFSLILHLLQKKIDQRNFLIYLRLEIVLLL